MTNIDIDLNKFNHVDFRTSLLNDFLKIDGALRDIYVDNCSISDWKSAIETIQNSDFSVKYLVDGVESLLTQDISSLFVNRENSHKLEFKKENVIINCFFFLETQMEFDLDPRDFVAEEQHEIIIEFLTLLTTSTKKMVKLTDENEENYPYLLLFPGDSKVFVSQKRY